METFAPEAKSLNICQTPKDLFGGFEVLNCAVIRSDKKMKFKNVANIA